MKIGIISDTHMTEAGDSLRQVVESCFRDAELILHAGDLTRTAVLEAFGTKKCFAVRGNMDRGRAAKILPRKQILTAGQKRIGLIHGWGSPWGIEERVFHEFSNVHAIVFGHTHKPVCRWKEGVLMFNPGAFSGGLLLKRNRSVGMLFIDEGIRGEHIPV
jgi:putative phosphoesterase